MVSLSTKAVLSVFVLSAIVGVMIFVAGSYWGVLSFILVVGMIIWRLVDEEEALSTELNG